MKVAVIAVLLIAGTMAQFAFTGINMHAKTPKAAAAKPKAKVNHWAKLAQVKTTKKSGTVGHIAKMAKKVKAKAGKQKLAYQAATEDNCRQYGAIGCGENGDPDSCTWACANCADFFSQFEGEMSEVSGDDHTGSITEFCQYWNSGDFSYKTSPAHKDYYDDEYYDDGYYGDDYDDYDGYGDDYYDDYDYYDHRAAKLAAKRKALKTRKAKQAQKQQNAY